MKVFFPPHANGQVDTISLSLPTTGLAIGNDTLILALESSYEPAGGPLMVYDTLRVPVEVLAEPALSIVDNALAPDSVYAAEPFDISFAVAVDQLAGTVDSTRIVLHLLNASDSILATLYDDLTDFAVVGVDTLQYRLIDMVVPESAVAMSGWYRLGLDLALASDGYLFVPTPGLDDSLFVLEPVSVTYDAGSLGPLQVSSGAEVAFEFAVMVSGTVPVALDTLASRFRVGNDGFSATAGFVVPGAMLDPGVNVLTTDLIAIPTDQLGNDLTVSAELRFGAPGAVNPLSAILDFGGQVVGVEELAEVQILEVSNEAPNAPRVNAGQAFQIACKIANMSATEMGTFELQMVSDGSSEFDPRVTVDGVPAGDTVTVFFDVVAAVEYSGSEIFRVDVATLGVNQLPPIDNIAVVTIQYAALLSWVVLSPAEFVTVGDDFGILLDITNLGEAEVTDAVIRISTNGMDLGAKDTLFTETIEVGATRAIVFTAPTFDTIITLDFVVIQRPFDFNSQLPAPISDTARRVVLAVTSEDVGLVAEAELRSSGLVSPGTSKDILDLTFINEGRSSVTDIRLQEINFRVSGIDGVPLSARDVFVSGGTGLYVDDQRVARSTIGGDRIRLLLDDYVVAAGDTAVLTLKAAIDPEAAGNFYVQLITNDIHACFASGPLLGRAVQVASASGDSTLLRSSFTTVGAGLSESFIVRNNPFNPVESPAEFRYLLSRAAAAVFRVLTLSGELVYSRSLAEGEEGGAAGENVVFWDGRNDDGDMVLDGVYVAVL
ncbi:MAG: hypothetical protein KKA42_09350, partial [candidate division Zixibacteria bacterium]|nr:hypothetical protein [candidate division Zixibacteria bacterium]